MLKRIVSILLLAALMVTSIPVNALATTTDSILYGDVNNDDDVNVSDTLLLWKYVAEMKDIEINEANADVNMDDAVNLKDLLLMQKFLQQWDVNLGPEAPCSVTVRMGNDEMGYTEVWNAQIKQNQRIDLPSEDELKELFGWSEAIYVVSDGYGDQKLENVFFTEETVVIDYKIDYQTYTLKVDGVQNEYGFTVQNTYTAKYGEAFDFSDLEGTGKVIEEGIYTEFIDVTTDATAIIDGVEQVIDLTQPVNADTAEAFYKGITATANYKKNIVTATFTFEGMEQEDIVIKLARGEELTTPQIIELEKIVLKNNLAVINITPELGPIEEDTTYTITGGEATGESVYLRFYANGGSFVPNFSWPEGSLLSEFPTTEKAGYDFAGWYTDAEFTQQARLTVPIGGASYYAKWVPAEYTVTFDVAGGDALSEAEQSKNVTYLEDYGVLPEPFRLGYKFIGWYTEAEGGTLVTEETTVDALENHTLYAQWEGLEMIPETIFDFGIAETFDYEKGVAREAVYTYNPEAGKNYSEDEFVIRYKCQGLEEFEEGIPVCAGTYDVIITRAQDDIYGGFEHTYENVLVVNKIERVLETVVANQVASGYTYMEFERVTEIDDLDANADISYHADYETRVFDGIENTNKVHSVYDGSSYTVTMTIRNDRNYTDITANVVKPDGTDEYSTRILPTEANGYWTDEGNYSISWYNAYADRYYIRTAEEFAGLAYLVNKGYDNWFVNKTVYLENDIDLSGKLWKPIGGAGADKANWYFMGSFLGQGHSITGVCIEEPEESRVGLFGAVANHTSSDIYARIENVVLEDGYIHGDSMVGGLVGYLDNKTTLNSCVNFAWVISEGDACGGLAGQVFTTSAKIVNGVNHGQINGNGNYTGGIAGYNQAGTITNTINYGNVNGYEATGGIVGMNSDAEYYGYIYNSANCGKVNGGSKKYIGAICGRNYKDYGFVDQCYYLAGSATCTVNSTSRKAIGTKDGYLNDGATSGDMDRTYQTASFTSPTSALSRDCGYGKDNLFLALDAMAAVQAGSRWISMGKGGYPVPLSAVPEHLRPEK
ncbi:MAG: InlB B-repeat-containing protein [Lachnospiraceae bacterium]|nr:InlB B-repeat-containing protein [Lachnospiraceae bacterium]